MTSVRIGGRRRRRVLVVAAAGVGPAMAARVARLVASKERGHVGKENAADAQLSIVAGCVHRTPRRCDRLGLAVVVESRPNRQTECLHVFGKAG